MTHTGWLMAFQLLKIVKQRKIMTRKDLKSLLLYKKLDRTMTESIAKLATAVYRAKNKLKAVQATKCKNKPILPREAFILSFLKSK